MTKKQMQKTITKSIKKHCKKYCESIRGMFLKIRKLKKEIMLTLEKNMLDVDRERKKEYKKNYYYKRKKLLNRLINCVELY